MNVVKKILMVLLAFLLFVGAYFLEGQVAGYSQAVQQQKAFVSFEKGKTIELLRDGKKQVLKETSNIEIFPGDTLDTLDAQDVEIHFGGGGVLRLAPQSTLRFIFFDRQRNGFVFELFKGKMWANSLFLDGQLNVIAGGAFMIPRQAVFYLHYDGEKAQISTIRHSVVVGLLSREYEVSQVYSFVSPDFLNSFLLTQNNQTAIFSNTIQDNADTIKKLFYSKLIKEVGYGLIDLEDFKNDDLVQKNLLLDIDFLQKTATDRLRVIRNRGLKVSALSSFGFQIKQAEHYVAKFLTFSDSKSAFFTANNLFDHLYDAEYLLLFGRSTEAKERLDFFEQQIQAQFQSGNASVNLTFSERLRREYANLAFVSPTEPLNLAKATLRNVLLKHLTHSDDDIREKFLLVRDELHDVYDLRDQNVSLARLSLEQYYQHFTALLDQESSHLDLVKNILAADNQIVDNLLYQYPDFYKDSYFAMKYRLELQWLDLIPDGDQKNEEKQMIISNKIDFLKQLKGFFLDDKVSLPDARQIVFRLFKETDALQLPPEAQVAVGELFAKRLEDFGVFFRYLSSAEYAGTTLHGSTRQEQFQQFLQAQQEQISIDQIRTEILGDAGNLAPTHENILKNVVGDFDSINISDVHFGTFIDPTQKYISIESASMNGVIFKAQYDWDQKLFSQVIVDDKLISADAVKLNNLAFLIQSATVTQQIVPETQETVMEVPVTQQPTLSKTELVARVLLLQKLKTKDLTITQDNVEILDLSQNQFRIHSAVFISDPSLKIAFDFDGKQNSVSHLRVLKKTGEEEKINGVFVLDDLAKQIKAESTKVKRN